MGFRMLTISAEGDKISPGSMEGRGVCIGRNGLDRSEIGLESEFKQFLNGAAIGRAHFSGIVLCY